MAGALMGSILALTVFALFQCAGIAIAQVVLFKENSGIRLLVGSVWGSMLLQWFPVVFAFFLDFTPAALGCGCLLYTSPSPRD